MQAEHLIDGAEAERLRRPATTAPAMRGTAAPLCDRPGPVRMASRGGLELMRAVGNPKAGLPFTVALDRRQRIVAVRLGVLTRDHLDAAVRRALR